MYNHLTSFVILFGWSIISGITGRFHRNMHQFRLDLALAIALLVLDIAMRVAGVY